MLWCHVCERKYTSSIVLVEFFFSFLPFLLPYALLIRRYLSLLSLSLHLFFSDLPHMHRRHQS